MHLIVLIFVFFGSVVAQNGKFPDKLLCNQLSGNYTTCCDRVNLEFGRPLESGDKVIINGTVGPAAGYYVRINIRDSTGNIIDFHMRTSIQTDVPNDSSKLLYNTAFEGVWGVNEYGPNPYVPNKPMQITIQYTGNAYLVYSGQELIKTYYRRHDANLPLMYLELNGGYSTNWVQMDCARPLPTASPSFYCVF